MSRNDANEAELIEVLDSFCSGFARRDPEAVLRVCAPDLDLAVVTSEDPLLRGPAEFRRFLDRYVDGGTTRGLSHAADPARFGSTPRRRLPAVPMLLGFVLVAALVEVPPAHRPGVLRAARGPLRGRDLRAGQGPPLLLLTLPAMGPVLALLFPVALLAASGVVAWRLDSASRRGYARRGARRRVRRRRLGACRVPAVRGLVGHGVLEGLDRPRRRARRGARLRRCGRRSPGHFVAQLRGAEPLWLVPYRGRDFVVDYPPLAMALWRWSWRAVTAGGPDLDHGEAENAAVKLPALLGDVAGVAAPAGAVPRHPAAGGGTGRAVLGAARLVAEQRCPRLPRRRARRCVVAAWSRPDAAGRWRPGSRWRSPRSSSRPRSSWRPRCGARSPRARVPARAIAAGSWRASLVPYAVAGTLETAIVHVYRILFQGTLSGGFPNPWWLLGHVSRSCATARPRSVPSASRGSTSWPFRRARSAPCCSRRPPSSCGGPSARGGDARGVTAGALLVLAYGVCAVGVHENHPHPLFLLLCATGLATARLRLAAPAARSSTSRTCWRCRGSGGSTVRATPCWSRRARAGRLAHGPGVRPHPGPGPGEHRPVSPPSSPRCPRRWSGSKEPAPPARG